MPLHAEILGVSKRRVEERVTVERSTRTKSVLVEESLELAGVVVEHVPVNRFVDAMPPVREEGGITIIPVVDEISVVVKRLFFREEIRVSRTRTVFQHVETVTLREQHARVTRTPISADVTAESLSLSQHNPMRTAT
ncbi:MAG: DUF2382 domain-containing protein, partial [Janthinobacterium lividum]